jgi:type I restriction enzyme S subunit
MREGWRRVQLGEVIELDIHGVDVTSEQTYDLAGVYSFGRGLFRRKPLTAEKTKYRRLHRLREGQLVMSKLKAWEGALAVVDAEFDGSVLSPEFPTFTLGPDVLHEWLSLIVSRPSFADRLRAESQGVGGRRERVHPRRLLQVEIDLPPIEEQRRVVDLVRSLDRYSEACHEVMVTARAAMWSMFDTLISERAGPTRPLVDLVDVAMGRQRSPKHAAGDNLIPYMRSANVKDRRLDLSSVLEMNFTPAEQERYSLQPGDVLVTEGGSRGTDIGASVVWLNELPGPVGFQNTLLRFRARGGEALPDFIELWASRRFAAGGWAELATGSTNIRHMGLARVKTLPVTWPPIEAQEEIVAGVTQFDAVARAAEQTWERAREVRRALLAELVSGTCVIPESYDSLLGDAA